MIVKRPTHLWLIDAGLVRVPMRVYATVNGHVSFRKPEMIVDPRGLIVPACRGGVVREPRLIEATTEQVIETWRDIGRPDPQEMNGFIFDLWNEDWYDQLTATTTTFLTTTSGSNQSWSVASDWNNASNFVDCIGSGGASEHENGNGGGGGAWSRSSNISLSGSAIYRVQVGSTRNGSPNRNDTWFNGTTLGGSSVGAQGGEGAIDRETPGGLGGDASNGVGSSKYSGGAGKNSVGTAGGGGGGAAGPNGDGEDATNAGGDGDAGFGGTGGAGTGAPDEEGGAGTEYDGSHGSGGGGGGGGTSSDGGDGGLYGGGAGVGTFHAGQFSGAQGLIVLVYTPATAVGRTQLIML